MLDNFEQDEGIRHFQRGVALERVNRIYEAVEEYRQAIASYPHLREAHAALGYYYQRNGLLAKSAEEFRIVSSLDGSFLSNFNLGHILVELEQYEEAMHAFQYCLRLVPDDPATHYEIAFIHFVQGEYTEALKYLELPTKNYPEDWEVLNLSGKCHLGLKQYDEAMDEFARALDLTSNPQIENELLDNLTTIDRYQEFETLTSFKDKMYVREGVICLGSSQDDGLTIETQQDYHFTYPDIGTTLKRFLALQHAYAWQFTAIVAVDKPSLPLAKAIGQLLNLPLCAVPDLDANDTPLMVAAVAREPELLLVMIEHAPCASVTFCLGLNWIRHSNILPDMTGVATLGACSVPWEPTLRRFYADGAPKEQIQACIEDATNQILESVSHTDSCENLQQQVEYYTRHHRRLSFYYDPEE